MIVSSGLVKLLIGQIVGLFLVAAVLANGSRDPSAWARI